MNQKEIIEKKKGNTDEIDLIEVALKIWDERKLILKTVAIFFVLGIIIAFGSKKEYKSECTFILDDNQGGSRVSGLLSQFGGLAGINIGDQEGNGIISPELYPNIIKSTPFMLELLDSKIEIEKFDTTISVFAYLNELEKPSFLNYVKKFTISLPKTILNALKKRKTKVALTVKTINIEIIKLTAEQEIIITNLSKRIIINLNEETGIITLGVELPDPVAAAEFANLTYKKLTEYLIDYKIDKATLDYNFINDRYCEAKQQYEAIQKELAVFRDQNKNVTTAFAQTEEERLQNKYQLAFNVYNSLAQQLEQSKIKIQEAMPVFKILNSVKVPLVRSRPKRSMVLILSVMLGFFAGIFIVFSKMVFVIIKNTSTDEYK